MVYETSDELWMVKFPDSFFMPDTSLVSFLDSNTSVERRKLTIFNGNEKGIIDPRTASSAADSKV